MAYGSGKTNNNQEVGLGTGRECIGVHKESLQQHWGCSVSVQGDQKRMEKGGGGEEGGDSEEPWGFLWNLGFWVYYHGLVDLKGETARRVGKRIERRGSW